MDPQIEKDIATSLKEILKWTRIQAMPAARALLSSTLSDASERRIYQALDGRPTQMQLAKDFKTSQSTISRLLASWVKAGIAEEASGGRYLRLFDLKMFDIEDADDEE
jgi:DNA-binding transcriptional MocR family regulator